MSILIKTVRIAGFRGLENIEVALEQTTILTGMNNSGKTSFLKALQLALGSRQFVSSEDFFIKESFASDKIIIDLLIVPINSDGKRSDIFQKIGKFYSIPIEFMVWIMPLFRLEQ